VQPGGGGPPELMPPPRSAPRASGPGRPLPRSERVRAQGGAHSPRASLVHHGRALGPQPHSSTISSASCTRSRGETTHACSQGLHALHSGGQSGHFGLTHARHRCTAQTRSTQCASESSSSLGASESSSSLGASESSSSLGASESSSSLGASESSSSLGASESSSSLGASESSSSLGASESSSSLGASESSSSLGASRESSSSLGASDSSSSLGASDSSSSPGGPARAAAAWVPARSSSSLGASESASRVGSGADLAGLEQLLGGEVVAHAPGQQHDLWPRAEPKSSMSCFSRVAARAHVRPSTRDDATPPTPAGSALPLAVHHHGPPGSAAAAAGPASCRAREVERHHALARARQPREPHARPAAPSPPTAAPLAGERRASAQGGPLRSNSLFLGKGAEPTRE